MRFGKRVALAVICVLVLAFESSIEAGTTPKGEGVLSVSIRPQVPFIEIRGQQQIVNLDLLVRNSTSDGYRLVAVRMLVLDRRGRMEAERELNENGKPPALEIVGDPNLPALGAMDIYQPFTTFDHSIDLSTMRFTLLFDRTGRSTSAVPLTADVVLTTDVHPVTYTPERFCLPLAGLLIVHDGHDLFSHHRRYNLARRFEANPATAVSANLFAYDLMRTTADGALYHGDLTQKQDWFSYGEPVRAPAGGTVLAAVTDVPENTFDSTGNAHTPQIAESMDPNGLGNYLELLHSDGRVSWLLHMQPGSVTLHRGDHITAGQVLGKVGFSGDSLFPHLHYTVTEGSAYPSQGVPSYFQHFTRVLGSRHVRMSQGQIDSGDLIVSDKTCLAP